MPMVIHLNVKQTDIILSDYVKALSDIDKKRYTEKLKVKAHNGSEIIFEDPYLLDSSKWSEDISMWPDIQYGNIYNYLIESPGEFSAECLKHYRSLEAYNYVLSGVLLSLIIIVTEAGKAKSIAKNVLKASVMNTAMGGRMHRPYHRRGFPIWGILLLVLFGGGGTVGLLVCAYCVFRRHQLCFRPTPV